MGRRSRERRAARASDGAPPAPAAPPSRSEARNEAVRARLEPLGAGERPQAVTIAVVLAVLMAVGNIVAGLAGADVSGKDQGNAVSYTAFSTALLLLAAYGMWRVRYWGVLGFQAILAFQIIVLAIALIRVETWWAGLLLTAVIGGLGWLFWKLVRAMARIQMPAPPGAPGARES